MENSQDLILRVELLEAKMEIIRLISTFSHGLDLRDRRMLRSVWFDDSHLDLGHHGSYRGIADIMAYFESSWTAIPHMHHWFADPLIEVDLDSGTANSSATVDVFVIDANTGPTQVAGIYRDRLARHDGRWGFTHRALETYYWTPIANWVPTAGTEARASRDGVTS